MKKAKKHSVSYAATPDEMTKLERIKRHYKRRTNTDAIRFLIEQEAEKILPQKCAIAQAAPAQG